MRGNLPPRDGGVAAISVLFYIILCCSPARHTSIHAAGRLELDEGPPAGLWSEGWRDACGDEEVGGANGERKLII